MALFEVPTRAGKSNDVKIAKKSNTNVKKVATTVKGGSDIMSRITNIKTITEKALGQFRETTLVIRDESTLNDYITKAIENDVIAIDTETTGLDPILDKIVGLCIYTPDKLTAYVPINHVSYVTGLKAENQLGADVIKRELERLNEHKTKIIMFNAPFDIRVIRNQLNTYLECYWDCYIAQRCMNENEPVNNLKALHNKYVLNGVGDAFRFDDLFKGITFDKIPIDVGSLYAAHDAIITYEFYMFQKPYLTQGTPECERCSMTDVAWSFRNVEMPCVDVTANMEDIGIEFDFDYNEQLKIKYHNLLDEKEAIFHKLIDECCGEEVDNYRLTNGVLEDPVNIKSSTQLAVLLYDILKVDRPIDKKTKQPTRSTDKNTLPFIDHPIAKAITEYREFSTIVSTFIDKLPDCVNPNDGRIHCKFNSYGADCITRESALLTSDGYKCIGDLFSGDEIDGEFYNDDTAIVNKNYIFENASHRVVYHNTPTIKLTLRGGYTIEGTYNHPIICADLTKKDLLRNRSNAQIQRLESTQHFKQLDSIKVDDVVAIPYGYNVFPTEYKKLNCELRQPNGYNFNDCTMPEYCNEEFAELLGMYHADGVIRDNDTFTIRICNADKDVHNRVKYLVKSLFNLDCVISDDYVAFSSVRLRDINKFLEKGARNKRVPDIIKQSPKSVICAYIKGMTLDSSLASDRDRLFITIVDKESFLFVQSALLNMGILTQTRYDKYKAKYDHMGNEVDTITMRRLGVANNMLDRFMNEIGVVQSSKYRKVKSLSDPHYITYNNVYYAYVTAVEYSVNDVYDLHVPNTHSFIANGLINHNTSRWSSNNPNMQNIPSHNKDIRKMFKATSYEKEVTTDSNTFNVDKWCEVDTPNGWKRVIDLIIGDEIYVDRNEISHIVDIQVNDDNISIEVE